jgi:MFS family permease
MAKTTHFEKNFLILAISQLISLFGNALQRYALSLYILDITGSAAIFSLILSLSILPQVFLAPFGGAVADRFSKKKILIYLDLLSAFVLLIFTLFSYHENSLLILVGVLMCALATIDSIYEPSVRSSIPVIVSEKDLTAANSVVSEISAVTMLLGPVAAGFLYGTFGIEFIFAINIISFLFSAGLEWFLHIPHTPAKPEKSPILTFANDIKESLYYLITKKKLIFYMIIISACLNLFLTPIYTVGIPYIEKIVFGVSGQLYGISQGFVGFGMITGALLVNVLSRKFPVSRIHYYFAVLSLLVMVMGLTTLPVLRGTTTIPYLSYCTFTFIGFLFAACLASINIIVMTFLQLETPVEIMGKIMALVTSLSLAFMPLGQIVFGLLYEKFSASAYIIYIFVTLISLAVTCIIYHLMKSSLFTSTKTAQMLSET